MLYHMNRTTICLDDPLMERVKERAQKLKKTLKDIIHDLIVLGLARSEKTQSKNPSLNLADLGKERTDISSRANLYQQWENDK